MDDPASAITHLGAYRIEGTLGQGGMGEVFLAWDQRLRRHVAIKRIRRDKTDASHRRRFRREAQAVARLNHPAIVRAHPDRSRQGDFPLPNAVPGPGVPPLRARGADGTPADWAPRLTASASCAAAAAERVHLCGLAQPAHKCYNAHHGHDDPQPR